MMKKCLIFSAMMAAFICTAEVQAQNLVFAATGSTEDHNGAVVSDGALVQLIWTTGTASGGTPPAPNLNNPEGLNAGETVINAGTAVTSGLFGGSIPNLTTAAAGEASVLYLRVFEQATTCGNNLPTQTNDGPGVLPGLWYADALVVQVVPDLGNAGLPSYSYFVDINQGDWQFVEGVIPEPGTLAFVLLALGGLFVRRRFAVC
jgi:hypothetical protein